MKTAGRSTNSSFVSVFVHSHYNVCCGVLATGRTRFRHRKAAVPAGSRRLSLEQDARVFGRIAVSHAKVCTFSPPLNRSNVIYVSGPEDDKSIIFEYPALGVHAVCHEPEVFERPCIYCQISDPCIDDEEQGVMFGDPEMEMNDEEPCEVGEEEEEEVGEEESDVFEILFSPKDPAFSSFIVIN